MREELVVGVVDLVLAALWLDLPQSTDEPDAPFRDDKRLRLIRAWAASLSRREEPGSERLTTTPVSPL
jgi:hypothetical protein